MYTHPPSSGMPGVRSWKYAPMSASSVTWNPRILPSSVAATVMLWITPRPWIVTA